MKSSEESWLRTYLELHEGSEVPDMFTVWCGLTVISAAVGRKVWMDMEFFKIFPNLYTVLIASSGRCRKSTAIRMGEKVLHEASRVQGVSLNIISQKITPEGLVEALQDEEAGDPGTGIIIASELSTFLNRRSYEMGMGTILVDLFDCSDIPFEYRTKARGVETIDQPCIILLGASTTDWLRDAVPIEAVGGGLTSRIIFVFQKEPKNLVPFPSKGKNFLRKEKVLIQRLGQIFQVSGKMRMTEDAKDLYKREYIRFFSESTLFNDKYLSGYASRRMVHLIKLGMLISLSEGTDLVVDGRHLDASTGFLEESEKTLREVMNLVTSTRVGSLLEWVYGKISSRSPCPRTVLLQNTSHQINARELSDIVDTLVKSNRVQVETDGRKVTYVATDVGKVGTD